MKYLKVVLGFLLLPVFLLAQQPVLEGGLFLGIANYQGDLSRSTGLQMAENNIAAGLLARHYLGPTKAIRANLIYGKLSASDAEVGERTVRNYSFETSVIEFSVVGEWEPFGQKRFGEIEKFSDRLSPYLFLGIGAIFMDPEASLDDNVNEEKRALDERADYSKVQFTLPAGLGLKIGVSETWHVGLEAGIRNPFTDYLDGISHAANPEGRDWYFFGGAMLMYTLR
ncbi:MAG: acyloxyacyl hydrolase [Chitinophagales bacterium]|nr:acyloxyacyl hydrolase [Chitinophagales bacterium]